MLKKRRIPVQTPASNGLTIRVKISGIFARFFRENGLGEYDISFQQLPLKDSWFFLKPARISYRKLFTKCVDVQDLK